LTARLECGIEIDDKVSKYSCIVFLYMTDYLHGDDSKFKSHIFCETCNEIVTGDN